MKKLFDALVDRVGYQNLDERTTLVFMVATGLGFLSWVAALVLTGTGAFAAVGAFVGTGVGWVAARVFGRICDRAHRRRRLAVIDIYTTTRRRLL